MQEQGARVGRTMKALAALCAAFALQACSSGDGDGASPPPPPPATATLQGRVSAAADGTPVAGATVSAGGATATTAADGSWSLAGLNPAERVLLRVSAAGFMDGLRALPATAGATTRDELPLLAAGAATSVDPTQAVSVQDGASSARLDAPANAFVRQGGGAPGGPLTVRLTSVDPALDPARMPGDYTTTSGGTTSALESFGAVQVDVRDAAGNRYTLAAGQSAQLRIPASSRGTLPDSVGLYSLDESTGRWVAEGTATLAGSGNNRWYEATITHLSWWNADIPLETIFVNGCLRQADGSTPAAARRVRTEGIDYTGSATAVSDAAGNFRVAMKRDARALVIAAAPAGGGQAPAPVQAGPASVDITLPACLVDRGPTPLAPTVLREPQPQTALAGALVSFSVIADGTAPLRYQWQRNGNDIAGATGPVYTLLASALDHAAAFRVRVSNAEGSVLSTAADLTVIGDPEPAFVFTPPASITAPAGNGVSFGVVAGGSPPISYQWLRNGQELPGATSSSYSIASVAGSDDGAQFQVRVSNPWGSELSAAATLTVTTAPDGPPVITSGGPQNLTASVGQQVRWPTFVSGTAPFSYEWRRNGALIAGATGNTLTFVVQQADDGAQYTVTVRNAAGSVTSPPGQLTVPAAPPTGSLAVAGDARNYVDGTFTPNVPTQGNLVSVNATGPLCLSTDCLSQWGMSAQENLVAGTAGTAEVLTVFVMSVRPSPGVQPGLQPTTVSVLYSVVRVGVGQPSEGEGYVLTCTANEPACPDPASAGIVVDPVARTVTFNNVQLRGNTGGGLTTLNGTLGY